MKIHQLSKLAVAGLFAFTLITSANAAQFFIDRQITIRDSSGNQLTNSSDFLAGYGWFVGGFTPTLANYSNWMSNFKGVAGYHNYSSLLNTVSAGPVLTFTPGPNDLPEEGVYDNLPQIASINTSTGLLGTAQVGDFLPENQSFALIIWNAATIASATEAAVITATSATWKVTNQFDVAAPDIVNVNASFGTASGLNALFGTATGTSTSTGTVQLALVPEPSTGALMMIGAVGLVALRRLRKV